jgi:transposase-like protein
LIGTFEPLIIKKHQKSVAGIEEQILLLYAKGVSTREIQDPLQRLHVY